MKAVRKDVSIEFPKEGLTVGCMVEFLGNDEYQLLEHPLMSESAKYGDIIKGKEKENGKITFIKVLKKSKYKMFGYILSKSLRESNGFIKLIEKLNVLGVYWQQDLGGCFVFFVPKNQKINLKKEINDISNETQT